MLEISTIFIEVLSIFTKLLLTVQQFNLIINMIENKQLNFFTVFCLFFNRHKTIRNQCTINLPFKPNLQKIAFACYAKCNNRIH